jgi:hypothetical protein
MGKIIKLDDFKEFREAKRNREIIIKAKKEMELERQITEFFDFIAKGTDLAVPDSGGTDWSLFTLAIRLIMLRAKIENLIQAIKEDIKVDWSGFKVE